MDPVALVDTRWARTGFFSLTWSSLGLSVAGDWGRPGESQTERNLVTSRQFSESVLVLVIV